MSKNGGALKAGNGAVADKDSRRDLEETGTRGLIASMRCVNPECNKVTATPYGRHDNGGTCCKACELAYATYKQKKQELMLASLGQETSDQGNVVPIFAAAR